MVQLVCLAVLSAPLARTQTVENPVRRAAAPDASAKPPAKKAGRAKRKKAEPQKVPIPPAQSIPGFTPEQLPAQPPAVSYVNGRLTVNSQNSTFGDVMTAVRRLTGVRFESLSGAVVENFPSPNERVAAVLSGPPREVISALLDGANLGYIMLSAPERQDEVKTVVLTASPQTQRSMPTSTGSGMPMPPTAQMRPAPSRPAPPPEDEDAPEAAEPPPQPPAQGPQGQQPGMGPGQGTNDSSQPQQRTPGELLQMLQQRNPNQGPGNPPPPPPPQPSDSQQQ
jgi:hypothetical protein